MLVSGWRREGGVCKWTRLDLCTLQPLYLRLRDHRAVGVAR